MWQEYDQPAALSSLQVKYLNHTGTAKQSAVASSCLPAAACLAQGVVSHIQSLQLWQAAHQALYASHLLDLVPCQVQVVQLMKSCQGTHVSDVAVLQRQSA